MIAINLKVFIVNSIETQQRNKVDISKLIKKAMIDKGVNNKFLSSKTGFDESKVSRIVNGKNSSLVDIDAVLGALGFKLTVVNK